MTEIERRKAQAEAQAFQQRAADAERRFRLGVSEIHTKWVELAETAWEIKYDRLWRGAGFSSLNDFLDDRLPDVGRTRFYRLAEFHEEFAVRRNVATSRQFAGVNVSNALEVLPAIRDGRADLDQAIEDARDHSVQEIREKYARAEQRVSGVPEPTATEVPSPAPAAEPEPERASTNGADAPAPAQSPAREECPTCGSLVDPEKLAA